MQSNGHYVLNSQDLCMYIERHSGTCDLVMGGGGNLNLVVHTVEPAMSSHFNEQPTWEAT